MRVLNATQFVDEPYHNADGARRDALAVLTGGATPAVSVPSVGRRAPIAPTNFGRQTRSVRRALTMIRRLSLSKKFGATSMMRGRPSANAMFRHISRIPDRKMQRIALAYLLAGSTQRQGLAPVVPYLSSVRARTGQDLYLRAQARDVLDQVRKWFNDIAIDPVDRRLDVTRLRRARMRGIYVSPRVSNLAL